MGGVNVLVIGALVLIVCRVLANSLYQRGTVYVPCVRKSNTDHQKISTSHVKLLEFIENVAWTARIPSHASCKRCAVLSGLHLN